MSDCMNPLIPADGVYRLSANKLSMYQACPFKHYLYLTHQESGEFDDTYIMAGNAVHKYMEEHMKGEGKPIESYIAEFNVKPEVLDRVKACIENAPTYLALDGIPELKEYTEFTTPKGRNIKLESRIDLQVDNADLPDVKGKVVIDYKTGKTIKTPKNNMQMQVYRFVRNFEYSAMLVSLYTGETVVLDKSPKNYIPNLCDRYIDAIENNDFPRKRGSNCERFCPYYQMFCTSEHMYDQIIPKMVYKDGKWYEE